MAEGFRESALSLLRFPWCFSLWTQSLPGGWSAVVPPVPIPNTVVKGRSADNTGGVARWNLRSPPGSSHFHSVVVTHQRFALMGFFLVYCICLSPHRLAA